MFVSPLVFHDAFSLQIIFVGLLLCWGAFLAFHTRDFPSAFNESYHIMMSLFMMMFMAIVILPVDWIVSFSWVSLHDTVLVFTACVCRCLTIRTQLWLFRVWDRASWRWR